MDFCGIEYDSLRAIPAVIFGLTAGFIFIGMNELGLITITGIAAESGFILSNVGLPFTDAKTACRSWENG